MGQEYLALSPTGALAIVFLGVGCSGLGYLFWYTALERLEASQVAAFLYVEPLFTLAAAVALLGESVAVSTVVGGVLVLLGVLAVQTAKPRGFEASTIVTVAPDSPDARVDGTAVACGALRRLGPDTSEVKRMYVRPAFRGRGLARRILAELEETARRRAAARIRLETGMRQPEAIALYRSAGYVEIALFGEYVGDPTSVCFEKRLTG